MSLKAFHIVFIIFSTVCVFGFGVWLLLVSDAGTTTLNVGGAALSFLMGAGLIVYGIKFLKKA